MDGKSKEHKMRFKMSLNLLAHIYFEASIIQPEDKVSTSKNRIFEQWLNSLLFSCLNMQTLEILSQIFASEHQRGSRMMTKTIFNFVS